MKRKKANAEAKKKQMETWKRFPALTEYSEEGGEVGTR